MDINLICSEFKSGARCLFGKLYAQWIVDVPSLIWGLSVSCSAQNVMFTSNFADLTFLGTVWRCPMVWKYISGRILSDRFHYFVLSKRWNDFVNLRSTERIFIARSALSIRAVHLILLSVSASVTKIIDLCEGDQKAASLLLSTGGLSSWFWRIPKVNCSKVKLRAGICRFRGPFFSTRLELFLWQS